MRKRPKINDPFTISLQIIENTINFLRIHCDALGTKLGACARLGLVGRRGDDRAKCRQRADAGRTQA
jgi:hypothetical protein